MTWRPISGAPVQYQKSNGTLASGYYLKFYQSGTTTAISMATDSTGGTTLAKCQLNSSGYPINGSSAVFIPHVNQKYKIVLYQNSTDADADTTGNADWVIDAVDQTFVDEWNTGYTAAYSTTTAFTIAGTDVTSVFTVGRAVKLTGGADRYAVVTSSSFSTDTTINVELVTDSAGATSTLHASMDTAYPHIIAFQSQIGDAFIRVQKTETGADATNLHHWINYQPINLKDYSATFDGTTDDTTFLQDAIDTYGNTYGDAPVALEVPPGTSLMSSMLSVTDQEGFEISGRGKFGSILQADTGLVAATMLYFQNGAYSGVRKLQFKALATGSAIGAAIQCDVQVTIQPTPQGMMFEDLYINGNQTGGFTAGLKFTAASDNNNERAFIKNCDFDKCVTGISIEHQNSLIHQIFGGVIGYCTTGISTSAAGGSFSANGVAFIGNSIDIAIPGYANHPIDIVNCRSEAGSSKWIDSSYASTGQQLINVINSSYHSAAGVNTFITFASAGKISFKGCDIIASSGGTRVIEQTHADGVMYFENTYFNNVAQINYAGTLIFGPGNTYLSASRPVLNPTATTAKVIILDQDDTPFTVDAGSLTGGVYVPTIYKRNLIINYAGTVTINMLDPTYYTGTTWKIVTIQAQAVQSNASNVVPVTGGSAGTAILAATDGAWCEMTSDGTNWVITRAG